MAQRLCPHDLGDPSVGDVHLDARRARRGEVAVAAVHGQDVDLREDRGGRTRLSGPGVRRPDVDAAAARHSRRQRGRHVDGHDPAGQVGLRDQRGQRHQLALAHHPAHGRPGLHRGLRRDVRGCGGRQLHLDGDQLLRRDLAAGHQCDRRRPHPRRLRHRAHQGGRRDERCEHQHRADEQPGIAPPGSGEAPRAGDGGRGVAVIHVRAPDLHMPGRTKASPDRI